jgi:ankyrin repeat protein
MKHNEYNCSLLFAALKGDTNLLISLLLSDGVNVNYQGSHNNTALHLAARFGHVETANILIKAGADLEAENFIYCYRPLHFAVLYNHVDIVSMLLQAGANINAVTHKKDSALHLATVKNYSDVTAKLIKYKIELNLLNQDGNSALHLASIYQFPNIASMLINSGANIEIINRYSNSALDLASNDEMRILLLKHGANTRYFNHLLSKEVIDARDFIMKFGFLSIAHKVIDHNQIYAFTALYHKWLDGKQDNGDNLYNFLELCQKLHLNKSLFSPQEKQEILNKSYALATVKHKTLGYNSPAKDIPIEILEKIAKNAFGDTGYSKKLGEFESLFINEKFPLEEIYVLGGSCD